MFISFRLKKRFELIQTTEWMPKILMIIENITQIKILLQCASYVSFQLELQENKLNYLFYFILFLVLLRYIRSYAMFSTRLNFIEFKTGICVMYRHTHRALNKMLENKNRGIELKYYGCSLEFIFNFFVFVFVYNLI